MRRKKLFSPALNPSDHCSCRGKVVLWTPPEQTNTTCHSAWCAVHSSSRANAGRATGRPVARDAPPPSQLPQPLLHLTAYPHSTASKRLLQHRGCGWRRRGQLAVWCSHDLLRPHRHRSMRPAYVVRLATQDNWVWRLLPPPRTSCLPEHEVENRDSRPLHSAPSCDKFQSHLHLERDASVQLLSSNLFFTWLKETNCSYSSHFAMAPLIYVTCYFILNMKF